MHRSVAGILVTPTYELTGLTELKRSMQNTQMANSRGNKKCEEFGHFFTSWVVPP